MNSKNLTNTYKINEQEKQKKQILSLVSSYIEKYGPSKTALKNTAPVSGKVVGSEEACNLVESSLDLWLTTGRFNDSFEKKWLNILV